MKIAIITNYWKNSSGGGIKTYLVNLVDNLKNRGCEVSVIFRNGYDKEQFNIRKNKGAFIIACYQQLRKTHPEVIHSQGTWYCLLPGTLYKKIHGCVLVYTFHTEPDRKLPFLSKVLFQNLLNACDCVTFVSKRLQEWVVDVEGLSFPRTAITYAGVRAPEVSDNEVAQFCQRYGVDESAIILLAIGMTALPYKAEGLKQLVLAVRGLRNKYPKILLIVTREGKYSEDLKAFVHEMGVDGQVVFTGDVDNQFVPLKLCDIYTHTPLGEGGVSIALLEAMALGKPIVATMVGGIPEAITHGENGLLVATEADQIAEKIDFLLQDKAYAEKLGKCAKSTVEERFTWIRQRIN